MVEKIHSHSESTKEKDEETEKKDHKKHAAKVHLGKAVAHKHVSREHHHKADDEPARPPVIEAPKRIDSDAAPQVPVDHVTAAEEAAWPDELKKLHDEIVGSVPKEDDDETDKPKKPVEVRSEKDEEPTDTGQAASQAETTAVPDQAEPEEVPEDDHAPEVTELTAMGLPEQIVAAEEAISHPEDPMPELPAVEAPDAAIGPFVPEAPTPVSAEAPEPIALPGELPVGDPEPLIPAETLEEFGYGSSDAEPWGQTAGGLANPKVLEKLDDIDKRERLNDAYHGSREAGLGAAVGLIGLGLILEHFAAKRRDKRLKKQLEAQGRQLKKTNQAVQLEQQSSQTSNRHIERIEAAQAAKSEHAKNIASAIQTAEIAASATVAAAEQGKTGISGVQEKVLADRLMNSKELGQAIKQNPELKDITDSQELVRSLEAAEASAAKQEQQVTGLQREASFEKLRGKSADNKGPASAGGGADAHGMPSLPTPQQQLPAGIQADLILDEHALIGKDGKKPSSAIVPVAAVTVLLILAALILIVFAKL